MIKDDLNHAIINCQKCKRLRDYCKKISQEKRSSYKDWNYWSKPVPNFLSTNTKLLIVGLAPSAHGANRTGRMFTGDRSGEWLYRALHKAKRANQAHSEDVQDGLKLLNTSITLIAHCAPPQNKLSREEIQNCHPFLLQTIKETSPQVFLALGQIAFSELKKILKQNFKIIDNENTKFSHGAEILFQDSKNRKILLIASYHPSQQNTFTGVLSEKAFDQIFKRINEFV